MFLNFSFSNGAVGYIADGVIDNKAVYYLRNEILQKLKEHKKINLYLEDAGVAHFSLNSIVTTLFFPHKHRNRFKKVAIVTDRKWIYFLTGLNGVFISATVRNYSTKKRKEAIAWISEKE